VFEWKRLYREGKLKLPGVQAAPTSSTELLPVNVIDLPVPMPPPAQLAANESPSTTGNVPPCVCEIEEEAASRLGIHVATLIRWVEYGLVKRHAYNDYAFLYEVPDSDPPTNIRR
jgi:hypothetical protein